ncbi:hypothetical protein SEA_SHAM_6 [Streptomyces phage Sham]|nr:hypothetical protein SEA_SHAM_6 [Streptomyces phage Sham]
MKISQTLDRVTEYLETQSEANAALHMSDRVMYPPLTSAAGVANKVLSDLIVRLYDEDNDGSKTEGPSEV